MIVPGVLEQCSCKNIHLWETEGAIGEEVLMQLSSIFKERNGNCQNCMMTWLCLSSTNMLKREPNSLNYINYYLKLESGQ